MGRIHSKQVCKRTAPEGKCFLVNTRRVTSVKDLVAAINSGNSISEAFVELGGSERVHSGDVAGHDSTGIELTHLMEYCGKPETSGLLNPCLLNIPLRVTLPPLSKESDLLKLLTTDRMKEEEKEDSIQTDTTDNNHGSEKVKISQNCGVTLEASSGQELQEWLFTLYDFDDLGKITKEDISGLLKSLYNTVGSVITLQQQGARVLKLHLTVSPGESSKFPDLGEGGGVSNKESLHKQRLCVEGRKVNHCNPETYRTVPGGHVGATSTKRIRTRYLPKSLIHGSPRAQHSKTLDSCPLTFCGKDRRTDATVSEKKETKDDDDFLLTRRQSFSESFRDAAPAAGVAPGANVRRRQQSRQQCSGASRRLSQFDERHLAHLIQQNMNLNDQLPQQPRKTRHRNNSFICKPHQTHDSSVSRMCTANYGNEECPQRRNYYLDLAGIENYSTSNACDLLSCTQPDCGVFGAKRFVKSPKTGKTKSNSATRNFTRCNLGRTDAHGADAVCEEDKFVTSNSFVAAKQEALSSPKLSSKLPVKQKQVTPVYNDVETVSSSHYHRRHRHRERNHSRAMKQVAEWIEKEHVYHRSEKRVVVVQRHEHHHVHEHFHHHFHHCNNST